VAVALPRAAATARVQLKGFARMICIHCILIDIAYTTTNATHQVKPPADPSQLLPVQPRAAAAEAEISRL
jgi:hypothetical protein